MAHVGWTHAICPQCWESKNPGREPIHVRRPPQEPCCFCGGMADGGIYVRAAPESVPLCQGHQE